jgi:hypothetical protein
MGNLKQGVYPLQAKGNMVKCEIRNGNHAESSIKSSNCSTVNQNNLTIYHQNITGIINKTEELLVISFGVNTYNLHIRASFKRL